MPTNGCRFRLKRTATHTSAGRVAHRCGRACIAPVESIVICDCSACRFFSYGRDRRPVAEPSVVLSLQRTVSTWPRDGANCCRVASTGYLVDRCPSEEDMETGKDAEIAAKSRTGSRSRIERLGDRQTSLHGATSSSSEKPPALLGNNCCDPIGAHSCFEFSCSSGTCRSGLVTRSWMRSHPHQLVLCKRQAVPAVCLTFTCQQHTSTARQYIRCSAGSKTVHVGLTSHAG